MLKLIHGDNAYESHQALDKILKTNTDVKVIDGSKLDNLDEMFVSAESLTLFSSKPSLTVVKRFSKNKKKSLQEKFVEKAKMSNLEELNIIFWEEKSADKRSKFYKLLKSEGKIKVCDLLDENKIVGWLRDEAMKLGINLSSKDAVKIIDRVGINQFNIKSELEKLALLLEFEKCELKEEHFDLISVSDKDADIWKLMDAISSRDKKKILSIGNEFLRNQSEFPYLITMITRQLKILLLMKHPQTTSQEISSKLKIHPYTLSRARKHLHLFEIERIKLLIRKLSNLDFAIKEGRIDPKLGLNLFLASL